MSNLTIQELIEFFSRTKDRTIPYENFEMVAAIRESSLKRDVVSLERLLNVMAEAYVRLNPDKPRETMLRNARETFAILAYLADYSPSSKEWISLGPVKAYAQREHYGRAMDLVKKIYDSQQIDLIRDVFRDTGFDPSLN